MKRTTLTSTQTRGLAQAFRESVNRPIRRRQIRLNMEANRQARWQLENNLTTMSQHLGMIFLTTNGVRATFATDESVYVYEIDPGYLTRRSWTPGRCIATLERKDTDAETLHAMARLLTPE